MVTYEELNWQQYLNLQIEAFVIVPPKLLVHIEIDYKSKELTNKEKDEINKDEVEANKGLKCDIKGQYNRRLRDKYG